MKKVSLILLLSIATNLMAQKDTLYFNANWNKCSKKEAEFYRPMPLKKVGNLYQVKNYYSSGNLQMEGYFTNVEKETLDGKAVWYLKNGQKSKESYSVEAKEKSKGIYKNNQPYKGDFYTVKSEVGLIDGYKSVIASLFHYKKGEKIGNQYVGFIDGSDFKLTDTIQYKSKKPYQGKDIEYYENLLHVHTYKKGMLVKTSIEDLSDGEMKFLVHYSDKGYTITHIKSNFTFCEVIYSDKTKQNAKVILYQNKNDKGMLEYQGNRITIIDLAFKEAGMDHDYTLEKPYKLVIKAKKERLTVKIYPELNIVNTFTYKDFLPDSEELFLTGKGDAVAYFYLDNSKNAISSCSTKNHKPYHGIVIQHYEDTDTFSFIKYKKGKRIDSKRNLNKEELLKLLKK